MKHALGVKNRDPSVNSFSAIDLAVKEYLSKHASGMIKSMAKVQSVYLKLYHILFDSLVARL